MGPDQMQEIVDIVQLVLSATKPVMIKGQVSRSQYELDSMVQGQAQSRVQALLQRYPLYPEIDLQMLLECGFSEMKQDS